jgi:hypothetical protein
MASDSELRDRFHEGTQPKGQIDVDAVLRRARARRRPRVALAAAGSVLAIAAIAVPAVATNYLSQTPQDTALVAGGDAAAPESATGGMADTDDGGADEMMSAPAEKIQACGAPLAEVAPGASGLVITLESVTAQADAHSIPVTATLTNEGDARVTGFTGNRPAVTLSDDGITLWHTNGGTDGNAIVVDLDPGESITYETIFEPVVCSDVDELGDEFRTGLPAAGPGDYLLSAIIYLHHDDDSEIDLVTGPASQVTLN